MLNLEMRDKCTKNSATKDKIGGKKIKPKNFSILYVYIDVDLIINFWYHNIIRD